MQTYFHQKLDLTMTLKYLSGNTLENFRSLVRSAVPGTFLTPRLHSTNGRPIYKLRYNYTSSTISCSPTMLSLQDSALYFGAWCICTFYGESDVGIP